MESQGMNHDITPPSKVQCPDAQQGWIKTGCLRVSMMELGDESFGALDVSGWAPFIFFDTITFPAY